MRVATCLMLVSLFSIEECKWFEDNNNVYFHRQTRTVSNPLWNETYLDKLRNDLLINYDKYAKPGEHYNLTDVDINLTIIYLDTDELNSTFSVSVWIHLEWKDPKLIWNKYNYDGIETVKMADHEVWQPDIYLFNSASTGGEAVIRYGNPHAVVNSDGGVIWILPVKFTALCEFDMYYWPFDTQHCYLKFGSGTRAGKDIRLSSTWVEVGKLGGQWKVKGTVEVLRELRHNYPEEFYHAFYKLILTRRSSSTVTFASTAIIVTVCLVLMQRFFMFKNKKIIIFSSFTSIVICIFLIYFGSKVAPMGSTAPWIVSFFSTSLLLNCFSLLESIVVVAAFKYESKPKQRWNLNANQKLRKILLLDDYIAQCESCVNTDVPEESKNLHGFEERNGVKIIGDCTSKHEWELVIVAIDRIFFICYSFVFIVLFLSYII